MRWQEALLESWPSRQSPAALLEDMQHNDNRSVRQAIIAKLVDLTSLL